MRAFFWLVVILGTVAATAVADGTRPAGEGVRIESVDGDGKRHTVLMRENRARIDDAIPGGYMILDLARGRAYAVHPGERLVLDLATPRVPPSAHAGALTDAPVALPEVRLEHLGPGPRLHGYDTVHYRIRSDGRHCFDAYLAREAAADPRIQRFLDTLGQLSDPRDEVRRNRLFKERDPCAGAAETVDDRYGELGLPLRTVGADGRVRHEILRIDLAARVERERLSWPVDYPLLSRQQVHERLQRQQNPPSLDEALQRQRRIEATVRDLGAPQ